MTAEWYVEIRPYTEDENDPGFLRMMAHSERDAQRIMRGANINLNHHHYYTRIIPPEPPK